MSFARDAADIEQARTLLRAAGGEARIVAKIERHEAVENLPGIIEAADVIMVARGDLGVEMGYAELTGLQKTIIHETRTHNKVVITATQMMESMIQNPVPTRAEVSDVANAVMDGTDAVMLSAETATGRYPLHAVQAMAQVIEGAEKYQLTHDRARQRGAEGQFEGSEEAIAMAVMYTANHMKVRAIVALTESGATPLWMSRIRSDIPVYAFTRHEATRRRVTLYRGVYPVIFDVTGSGKSTEALYRALFTRLLELRLVKKRDLVIPPRASCPALRVARTRCRSSRSCWNSRREDTRMRQLKYFGVAVRAAAAGGPSGGLPCLRGSLPQLDGSCTRPARRPGAHHPRCARRADHRGRQSARSGLRHRLPARPGPLLRDGPLAPPRRRGARGDVRPGGARAGPQGAAVPVP